MPVLAGRLVYFSEKTHPCFGFFNTKENDVEGFWFVVLRLLTLSTTQLIAINKQTSLSVRVKYIVD